MNNEIKVFYDELYKLSYITRYSGVPRIKDESVAEHSFYVASLVIKLHDYYEFDLGRATVMAVTHDWAETFIGDVTIQAKLNVVGIDKLLGHAESIFIRENFSRYVASLCSELSAKESIESLIVMLADVIQCKQYSSHEISLGNKGYMDEVFNHSKYRDNQLSSMLVKYER